MALEEAGTSGDPYLIESASDWDEIPTYDSGTAFFRLENDIDYGGNIPSRIEVDGEIDFNGFRLHNLCGGSGFQSGSLFLSLYGTLKNGEINVTVAENDGNSEAVINILRDSGTVTGMEFTGSISATGSGFARIIATTEASSTLNNVIFGADLSTVDANCSPLAAGSGSADKIVSTGTYTSSGTGSVFGVTASATVTLTNSFYDTTKNSGVSDNGGATGKTTTELQDIDTYTNLATSGLDEAYDMVAIGSYVDETWAIDDGNAYPVLGWSVEASSNLTGTAKILGTVKSGVTAVFFESDDVELTNFNKLGTDTSDVNGEVEYTGTYDDTKHIGVMWYILEFDEADNPTVWAMVEFINDLDLTPPA